MQLLLFGAENNIMTPFVASEKKRCISDVKACNCAPNCDKIDTVENRNKYMAYKREQQFYCFFVFSLNFRNPFYVVLYCVV